jgi:hypothetical protein
VDGERGVRGARLTGVKGVPHPTCSSRHEERVLIVCGRTLILCRTYRGLVSEENLRHSSRRIEKGTAKFREEARTSSNFLLLPLFSNQRVEGVKIPGPEKNTNNCVWKIWYYVTKDTTFKF